MHPFHLATVIMFISHILLIPIGYYRLFRFTERNISKVAGSISAMARIRRKKQNLVTAKFNFLNWLLEVVSLVVVLAGGYGKVTSVLYIFLTSCGPPCIYFLGVEENRKAVKQSLTSRIKNVKQKKGEKENEEGEQRDEVAEQRDMEENEQRENYTKKQGIERVKDKTKESQPI